MRATGSVKSAMGFHQKDSCEIIILRIKEKWRKLT